MVVGDLGELSWGGVLGSGLRVVLVIAVIGTRLSNSVKGII